MEGRILGGELRAKITCLEEGEYFWVLEYMIEHDVKS
tara:strand:- start:47 stop:157 length:111 start_codon:yes stop_codon:yes gene_type:complete